LDGYFCKITKPRKVENTADYYSGHYSLYGINVQAMCDSRLRFTYLGILGPGRTNDYRAHEDSIALRQWLNSLPYPYFIIADNAYPTTSKLLTPFRQMQLVDDDARKAFNYYLSQLRCRIELAFGRMTNKFRILKENMTTDVERTCAIVQCIARLHNFIINDGVVNNNIMNDGYNEAGMVLHDDFTINQPIERIGYLPVYNNPTGNEYSVVMDDNRRNMMVGEIAALDLRRPVIRARRRTNEEHERQLQAILQRIHNPQTNSH
jgi:hypothetical protein